MKEIKLGATLIKYRHKRGITQDALAEYIGVSKAAVSKWETSATYPDIAILPRLAAFFNISIDELLGYEPQMTKEDIRKLYKKLSAEFSSNSLEAVLEHCREIVKKYFSCIPLLLQIGILFLNHSMLTESSEKTSAILEEARELFVRVKTETEDISLAKQASNLEAVCLLSLGRTDEVLDLLGEYDLTFMPQEPLLASAYQMTGNMQEAKRILQTGIYQWTIGLINLLGAYMGMCQDDAEVFEETYKRISAVAEAFWLKTLHPSGLMTCYILAAQGFAALGQKKKALELLERYVELTAGDISSMRLHGDFYFNLLDDWLENTLDLGGDLPRDAAVIRQSMIQAVIENPEFKVLEEEVQFQKIVERLREGGENQI